MSYKIETTFRFERSVKLLARKYSSLKSDLLRLRNELLQNPFSGTPLGKDCYKIRLKIASKGKGKSGGGRVITCVKIHNEIIYLLLIYDKSDKESIPDKELDTALKEAGLL
jgi:mRNA-degrading endonuclease RelE of RelBE toxin-antitoxin system